MAAKLSSDSPIAKSNAHLDQAKKHLLAINLIEKIGADHAIAALAMLYITELIGAYYFLIGKGELADPFVMDEDIFLIDKCSSKEELVEIYRSTLSWQRDKNNNTSVSMLVLRLNHIYEPYLCYLRRVRSEIYGKFFNSYLINKSKYRTFLILNVTAASIFLAVSITTTTVALKIANAFYEDYQQNKIFSSYQHDFIHSTGSVNSVKIAGIGDLEYTEHDRAFRWGYGPKTLLAFVSNKSGKMQLDFELCNVITGLNLDVYINGNLAKRIHPIVPSVWPTASSSSSIEFQAAQGVNTIEFIVNKWNMHDALIEKNETRELSIAFFKLNIKALSQD